MVGPLDTSVSHNLFSTWAITLVLDLKPKLDQSFSIYSLVIFEMKSFIFLLAEISRDKHKIHHFAVHIKQILIDTINVPIMMCEHAHILNILHII